MHRSPDTFGETVGFPLIERTLRNASVGLLILFAACSPTATPVLKDTAAMASTSPSIAVLSSTATIESASVSQMPALTDAVAPREPADVIPENEHDLAILGRELIIPVSGVVASELRDTYTEARGTGRLHDAIDIPAPRNTPVLSATNGRVLKLFTSKAGGLMVYAADSTERFILLYAHLESYAPGLADGQQLTRGQTIGFVGTTGNSPPNLPHLHFAIERAADISKWWKGTAVNPYPLFKSR